IARVVGADLAAGRDPGAGRRPAVAFVPAALPGPVRVADDPGEGPVRVDFADHAVGASDQDVVVPVDRHLLRVDARRGCRAAFAAGVEGGGRRAGTGERGDRSVRVDFADAPVEHVGDVHVLVSVDRDRVREAQPRLTGGAAVAGEALLAGAGERGDLPVRVDLAPLVLLRRDEGDCPGAVDGD